MRTSAEDKVSNPSNIRSKIVQGEIVDENEFDARKRLEALAWLFDNSIAVPGLNVRIGLDAIIGLLPGIGDLLSAIVSTYLMAEASRLGASRGVLLRMAGNVFIDTFIGAIPVVGDLFDMGWKANTRNVRLLVEHLDRPRKVTYTSWLIVAIFGIVLLAVVIGLGYLLVYGFATIWNAF